MSCTTRLFSLLCVLLVSAPVKADFHTTNPIKQDPVAERDSLLMRKGLMVGGGFNHSFLTQVSGGPSELNHSGSLGGQGMLIWVFAANEVARARLTLEMSKTNYSLSNSDNALGVNGLGERAKSGIGFGMGFEWNPRKWRRLYGLTEFGGLLPLRNRDIGGSLATGVGFGWAKPARKGVHKWELIYQHLGSRQETQEFLTHDETWTYAVNRVALRWLFL